MKAGTKTGEKVRGTGGAGSVSMSENYSQWHKAIQACCVAKEKVM